MYNLIVPFFLSLSFPFFLLLLQLFSTLYPLLFILLFAFLMFILYSTFSSFLKLFFESFFKFLLFTTYGTFHMFFSWIVVFQFRHLQSKFYNVFYEVTIICCYVFFSFPRVVSYCSSRSAKLGLDDFLRNSPKDILTSPDVPYGLTCNVKGRLRTHLKYIKNVILTIIHKMGF